MSKKDISVFDHTAIFREKIEPFFQTIKKKCMEHDIPFFFIICIKNTEYESVYKIEKDLLADKIVLSKNYFDKLQKIYNGGYNTSLILNQEEKFQQNPTVYDKTDLFMKEISPLLFKLKKMCNRLTMPFFFTACVKNKADECVHYSDMLASVSNYIFLRHDILPDLVNVMNDFEIIKEQELEIDMEDLCFFDGGGEKL